MGIIFCGTKLWRIAVFTIKLFAVFSFADAGSFILYVIYIDYISGEWTDVIIAERRERSERSEANNRVLFEIPRYLYIYNIYIYVCLQRALHKTVHTLRKSYHVGHCAFGTQAAVRSTTLRSRPFARYGRRRQFS